MKLHLFSSGSIITWRHLIIRGEKPGVRFQVPVPFYLVEHPDGLFLFDTGQQPPTNQLPDDADYIPQLTDSQRAVNLLAHLGIHPDDLTGIVISHTHSDHAGGLVDFPHTPCYIRRAEVQTPFWQDLIRQVPGRWIFPNSDYDLTGDGKIILLDTPGHTPGHQSLLLTMSEGRKILLTADAAYTRAALEQTPADDEKHIPYWASIRKIRQYADSGTLIITGHDPAEWTELPRLFI